MRGRLADGASPCVPARDGALHRRARRGRARGGSEVCASQGEETRKRDAPRRRPHSPRHSCPRFPAASCASCPRRAASRHRGTAAATAAPAGTA
eukprot:5018040-Prymnesium_polylepis.1